MALTELSLFSTLMIIKKVSLSPTSSMILCFSCKATPGQEKASSRAIRTSASWIT